MSTDELELLTLKEEAINDALGAVKLLRSTLEVDAKRIFVLGHSQGGTALPRIAKAEAAIAGFVSLAGSTRALEDVVLEQVRYLAAVDGTTSKEEASAIRRLEAQVARVKKLNPATKVDASTLPLGIPANYWLDLSAHPPSTEVIAEKRPFLVLQGERDYQVTMADFGIWQRALANNPRARFKTYPRLNHGFVSGEGPSTPADYQAPGNVAEEVVRDVADFVLNRPY
jgi:dienelactone hydrolase